MTTCPHCTGKLKLEQNNAYGNYMAYGKPTFVLTKCCGKFVTISAQITYTWYHDQRHHPYAWVEGNEIIYSDDWGNEKRVSKG